MKQNKKYHNMDSWQSENYEQNEKLIEIKE
jgi:hypothetical protein